MRFPPLPAFAALALTAPVGPSPLAGQDPETFLPATLDSMEEASASAPLFATEAPLEITLSTRVEYLVDERPEEEEEDGWIYWTDAAGTRDSVDVEVRTRGNFRRDKRNCSFPPLRLDIPRSRAQGTPFQNQDKLKLVTPCRLGRDDYEEYVHLEYLAYRVYNLVTPASYRVRRVEITLEDVDGEFETRTTPAFLIEADEEMAHRNRAFLMEFEQWHPMAVSQDQAARLALFQLLIGNTDWSQPFFHNTDLIRTWEGGRYLPVPYDFDFSGVVDARYAEPDPSLGTGSVRDRVYRGFCYRETDHQAHRAYFLELEEPVGRLYREASFLPDDVREDALDYVEEFFEMLADDGRYRRVVLEGCLRLPGGP